MASPFIINEDGTFLQFETGEFWVGEGTFSPPLGIVPTSFPPIHGPDPTAYAIDGPDPSYLAIAAH